MFLVIRGAAQDRWALRAFAPEDVSAVEIRQGAETTRMTKLADKWKVVVAVGRDHGGDRFSARTPDVVAIIDAWSPGASATRLSRRAPLPEQLREVGLGEDQVTQLSFLLAGGEARRILIGDEVEGGHVVRRGDLDASTPVYRLALPAPRPSANPLDWADKRLFLVDGSSVLGIDVEGTQAVHLQRASEGQPWTAAPDVVLRQRSVDLLLNSLVGLEWSDTLAIGADFHGYGDAIPIATTIRLRTEAPEPVVIELSEPLSGATYAKRGNALFVVDPGAARRIHEAPEHLTD